VHLALGGLPFRQAVKRQDRLARERRSSRTSRGHLHEWFAQHATRFAVIRPDRYVAAQADEISLGAAIGRPEDC
jgi:hypothetical protein